MLYSRAPEEYPKNLGLIRPNMLRADFDKYIILQQTERCYRRHGHVRLLTFWGIGWKPLALESDRLAMSQLGLIAATLQNTLRMGVRLTLLVGDNHACANEVPNEIVQSYVSSIRNLAEEFAYDVRDLSSIYPVDCSELDHMQLTSEENAVYAPDRHHYEKSARHLRADNFERRAKKYFLVRYREREGIAREFPDSIIASPDIHKRAALTPPLPTFYIYPLPFPRLRKSKPWFLDNF